jgi:hypothetical protein
VNNEAKQNAIELLSRINHLHETLELCIEDSDYPPREIFVLRIEGEAIEVLSDVPAWGMLKFVGAENQLTPITYDIEFCRAAVGLISSHTNFHIDFIHLLDYYKEMKEQVREQIRGIEQFQNMLAESPLLFQKAHVLVEC